MVIAELEEQLPGTLDQWGASDQKIRDELNRRRQGHGMFHVQPHFLNRAGPQLESLKRADHRVGGHYWKYAGPDSESNGCSKYPA